MRFSLALVLLGLCGFIVADDKNIFCYFESWTVYRPGNGKFDVANIEPDLCTHVCFTFLGVNEDGSVNILDPWESNDEGGYQGFRNIVALKQKNPSLKVLVSMGGWNEGSEKYSVVAADPLKRLTLANSVLDFIEEWGFDGFDLDWEYPARRDSDNAADKGNFVLLLKALKSILKPNGYILTAAVGGGDSVLDISYDVPEVNNLLDHLNVMVYDFHGAFEDYVGHNVPLYASSLDNETMKTWNVDGGIDAWLDRGADAAKINMGIATYGRSFTLADSKNTSLYAPSLGGGLEQPYTRQEGIMGYNELCELNSHYEEIWDDEQQVPHYVSGDQWVGLENPKSIAIKTKYALSKNLGGFMIWSFDTDDFRGLCGGGTYPLIKSIKTTLASIKNDDV